MTQPRVLLQDLSVLSSSRLWLSAVVVLSKHSVVPQLHWGGCPSPPHFLTFSFSLSLSAAWGSLTLRCFVLSPNQLSAFLPWRSLDQHLCLPDYNVGNESPLLLSKKIHTKWIIEVTLPALEKQRQVHFCEFHTTLVYKVISGPTIATQWDPVFKNKNKEKQFQGMLAISQNNRRVWLLMP